jgi:hypothetical protein
MTFEDGLSIVVISTHSTEKFCKSPITPEESRTMMLRVSEATHQSDVTDGTDKPSGGLLFFKDTAGSRYMVPINIGATSPTKVSPFLLTKE